VALVLPFLLLLAAGCASSGGATALRGNVDLIEREDILGSNRGTAYEVIEMLRPQWLRERSDQSVLRQGGIQVYVDDVRYGDIASLRGLNAREIFRMQRYNATAASQRWGPGHSEGVIYISTRAGGV
jgi:hypothetical protein